MSEFDVNFDKLLLDLARVQSTSSEIGASFDKLEAKLGHTSTGMAKALKALDDSYDKVRKSVRGLGGDTDAVEARLKESHHTIKGSLSGMVTSATQAEIKYRALRGEYGELGRALSNTQAFNLVANAMMKVQNLTTELSAQSEVLKARRDALGTTEGQLAANRQAQLSGFTRLTTAETRQLMMSKELTQSLKLQASERGASIAVQKAQLSAMQSEQQETTKLTATLATLERRNKGTTAALHDQLAVQKAVSAGKDAEASSTQRLSNRYEEQRRQAEAMGTTLGRQILLQSEKNRETGQSLTFAQREASQLAETRRVLESYNSGKRAEMDLSAQVVKAKQQEVTFQARMIAQGAELTRQLQSMAAGQAKSNAMLAESVAGAKAAATFNERQSNSVAELHRRIESLVTGGYGKEEAALKQLLAAKTQASTHVQREILELERLERELNSAVSGRRREISVMKERIKAADAEATSRAREASQLAELRRQISSSEAGARRTILLLQEELRARDQATVSEAKQANELARLERQYESLNGGLAESIVRQKELNRQRQASITADMRASQASSTLQQTNRKETESSTALTRAQSALNQERERSVNTLARLRAQATMLNGSYGVQRAALESQIKSQREYNRLLAMSTSELLGFSKAKRTFIGNFNSAHQAGAMLRATMGGLKANIGMYTSSTILAASATYAIARAIRSALEVGVEFDYTMSRVQAIMTGTMSDASATATVTAMEGQIRSLAQTTMFTAAEVSKGMEELGMAGLSASQAMVALQPALDLAIIGNIEMGEAADIATNVMMTFGLEATDLAGVVDLLASSVTNSNTTISQLANALSYVGPAAEAAGFSIEDTVAAISTLANVGIKGSRAGTGLRRTMANLLNPTTKGAAMLRRYGIAVDDAAGNTRDFQDILKQLNIALHDDAITPAERLAAIIDLVGVRASSAASSLIEQTGDTGVFTSLRQQFESVEGAAAQMRKTIQDSMRMDFRNVLSSFQEVQLTAMDSQAERLSVAAVKISNALIGLSDQAEGFDKGFTKLDVFLARVERIAEALVYLGTGYVAFKFAAGGVSTLLGAAANTTNLWADRLNIVSENLTNTSERSQIMSRSMDGQTRALMLNEAATNRSNAAMARLAGTTSTATMWASRFAGAVSIVSRLAGWAGLLVGIGFAVRSVFSGSVNEDIKEHKEGVAAAVEEYKELKEAAEKAAFGRTRVGFEKLVEDLEKSLEKSEAKIMAIHAELARAEAHGEDTTGSASYSLLGQIGNQRVSDLNLLAETKDLLGQMGESALALLSTRGRAFEQQKLLNDLLDEQITKQAELESQFPDGISGADESGIADYYTLVWRLEQLAETIPEVRNELNGLNKAIEDAQPSSITAFETLNSAYQTFLDGDVKDFILSQGSAADRAAASFDSYSTSVEEYNEQVDLMRQAEESGDMAIASQNALMRTREALMKNWLEYLKAEAAERKEREAAEKSLLDVHEQYLQFHMTETELAEHLRAKLAEVTNELALKATVSAAGHKATVEELNEEARLMTEFLSLSRQLAGMGINKPAKPTRDTAAEELERAISQAEATYQSLLQVIDPVAASLQEMGEKQQQLALLLEHTDFTQDQYRRGLFELQKAHVEVELAQEKNLEALYALQQEYSKSPFESTIEDMLELQRLYDEGAVSMDRYMQLSQQMKAKANADAISGAPTTSFQMQGAASTPFNELGSTMIGIAEGNSWYDTRGQELVQGQNMSGQLAIDTFDMEVEELRNRHARMMELNRENQEAQLALTKEYDAKVLAAEDRKNDAIRQSQDQLNRQSAALTDDRKRYEEESSKLMMISMLGTAESILGMFASVGEDSTTAQKVAFAAQKALGVAQILLYTHIAAAKANSELPVFAGLTMSELILAQGYASAGLVSALSIGELAGGGSSGSYAGAYDKGGWIPAGKWGVVGEYGPEMVHGPANVTGREKTSKMLGGGGDEFNITLAPVINVESSGNGDGSNSEEEGKILGNTLKLAVLSTLQDQMRPNGMLDTWVRGARRG